MKTFIRWQSLALAALLAWPAVGAAFELTALMEMLALVPAANGRFTETKHSTILSTPLVLKGTLVYVRPDRLEKNVVAPYEERTMIVGNSVTIYNRALMQTRTFSLDSFAPVSAFVESMRATLAGDRAALERHYSVRLEGQAQAWTLTLMPREQKLASLLKRIQIAGVRGNLKRIEVEETSGDWSVTLISPD
ncbi:MAG: outer membrane lipoprotein carrier protein LolA [Betaproteobacteria bacterium]|nr:outer membrane lipoprotein carrier protein LolA [Betaproteobacteria bacterium]